MHSYTPCRAERLGGSQPGGMVGPVPRHLTRRVEHVASPTQLSGGFEALAPVPAALPRTARRPWAVLRATAPAGHPGRPRWPARSRRRNPARHRDVRRHLARGLRRVPHQPDAHCSRRGQRRLQVREVQAGLVGVDVLDHHACPMNEVRVGIVGGCPPSTRRHRRRRPRNRLLAAATMLAEHQDLVEVRGRDTLRREATAGRARDAGLEWVRPGAACRGR